MNDREFLSAAEALARKHPHNELAIAFLQCLNDKSPDHSKCMGQASQIILKLIDIESAE